VPQAEVAARVAEMVQRFGLGDVLHAMPDNLPLGVRQRLSLAVAMVHKPELLILDEPTSGVDPIARDNLWQLMIDLSRNDKVTIFISTHFMNEAARCDRVSLMNAGKVLVTEVPAELVRLRGTATLEEAFIGYLKDANATGTTAPLPAPPPGRLEMKPLCGCLLFLLLCQGQNACAGQLSALFYRAGLLRRQQMRACWEYALFQDILLFPAPALSGCRIPRP